MSEEKQIFENLAEDILEEYARSYSQVDKESLARKICEKSKTEVAMEIFEEIEKLHLHITNEFDLRRYNELKKKYTEDNDG